ncbi:MAG TPA: DUF1993 domain-containing protein [Caulobacteraceae bacterium]|nr:DUF1993 domain-containing protein [Caulobacteraceae bacterium]
MSLSLYDASIPAYLRMLKNLSAMLDKGEAYAKDNGIALSTLVQARLAPDMGDLARQVQFASDSAKGGAARLAGLEPPAMPDTETTLPELKDRIARTVAFVETVKREQVDGQEGREIVLKFPGRTMTFTGADFLLGFSMPNFLFHVTTAYDVLRSQGVPLQKMDYLMGANVKVTMDAPAA